MKIQPTTTTRRPDYSKPECKHTAFTSNVSVNREASEDETMVRWIATLTTKCSQCGVPFTIGHSIFLGQEMQNISLQIAPGNQ